jgi:hypothetical protein
MDGNVAHHAEQVKPSSKDQLSPVLLLLFGTSPGMMMMIIVIIIITIIMGHECIWGTVWGEISRRGKRKRKGRGSERMHVHYIYTYIYTYGDRTMNPSNHHL